MKKYLLLLAFLLSASTAQAGMYISGGIGESVDNNSKTTRQDQNRNDNARYDNASMVAAAIGLATPVARLEVEGLYNKSDMKNGARHLTTGAAFVNAYAQIPVVGVYAGAGMGFAFVKNERAAVYQEIFGFEYGMEVIFLDMEYKHIQTRKDVKEFNGRSGLSIDSFMMKLRIEF